MLKNSQTIDETLAATELLRPIVELAKEANTLWLDADKAEEEAKTIRKRAEDRAAPLDSVSIRKQVEAGKALAKARQALFDSGLKHITWTEFCKEHVPRSERHIRRLLALTKANDPYAAAAALNQKAAEGMQRTREKRRTNAEPVSPAPQVWATQADKVVMPPAETPPAAASAGQPVGGEAPIPPAVPLEETASVAAPQTRSEIQAEIGEKLEAKITERAEMQLCDLPVADLLEHLISTVRLRNQDIAKLPMAERTAVANSILIAIGVAPSWVQNLRDEQDKKAAE